VERTHQPYESPSSTASRVGGRCRAALIRLECGWVELHAVEGYTVVFADGRRLGRVAWVEYRSRSDEPDVLVVRRRFYQRPPLVRVPVAMVANVEHQGNSLVLDVGHHPEHFFLHQPL
jgi:hypothetical protein